MIESVETRWMGDMAFESQIDGFPVKMDADQQFGGTGFGFRPKPLVLSSLAGCTGMDIVSILQKKKVNFRSFNIAISAEVTETHPKYYKKIHMIFEITGEYFSGNQDILEKVERAVRLSAESYCGVSTMLKNTCEISREIRLISV
jgi:putative redox protein